MGPPKACSDCATGHYTFYQTILLGARKQNGPNINPVHSWVTGGSTVETLNQSFRGSSSLSQVQDSRRGSIPKEIPRLQLYLLVSNCYLRWYVHGSRPKRRGSDQTLSELDHRRHLDEGLLPQRFVFHHRHSVHVGKRKTLYSRTLDVGYASAGAIDYDDPSSSSMLAEHRQHDQSALRA